MLKEIGETKLAKIQTPIISDEYMKILNNTTIVDSNNLNCLTKMNLEEIRVKDSNNNQKCIKCNRIASYKNNDNETLLCWNHSIE